MDIGRGGVSSPGTVASRASERVIGDVPLAVTLHLALIEAYERANHINTRYFARWGLTPQQYNAVRILYFGEAAGVRLSDIGDRLLQRVPDVSRLVDRLERAGFARRAPDPEDGRGVLVELTTAGRTLVEDMDDDLMENMTGWYAGLTPVEQRRLVALLRRTVAVLDASIDNENR